MLWRLRHWLSHRFGLNGCVVVGELDLKCLGCGRVYPATAGFKQAMRALTRADEAIVVVNARLNRKPR